MTRAAHQHVAAMVEPLSQRLAERDDLWRHAVDQHVHVDRDPGFELGQPEQRFHQGFGLDRAAPRFEHDAHVLGRFVAHVGEQRKLALVKEIGDLLDQSRLLHSVRNLADHRDPAAAPGILLRPARPHPKGAAAGPVGFDDRRLAVDDDAAGREIRPLYEIHERGRVRPRLLDQMQRGVAEFGDIVRRDRRRHADRDPLRAIGEQVRHGRGHDDRLLRVAGIIVAPVDRIFLDALHDQARDIGQARLGVAIGRGVIAVDIAEIALPLDQGIARGEVLRQTHQRLIDRLVAVRVERPHHVADDLGAFLEGRVGVEFEDVHAVENAAMHGLEPVAGVGERPAHDGGEGVGEIALFQRLAQVDLDRDRRRRRGRRNRFGHEAGLARRLSRGKPGRAIQGAWELAGALRVPHPGVWPRLEAWSRGNPSNLL